MNIDSEMQHYETRVRESFSRQRLMTLIGARLVHVLPGEVVIDLPFRDDLTQQHGFLHGGIVTTVLDSAAGYAALSLMPPDAAVLTVELKVNLLAPAEGELLQARGRVIRRGRTLTVCEANAVMISGGNEKSVATMLTTMINAKDRERLVG